MTMEVTGRPSAGVRVHLELKSMGTVRNLKIQLTKNKKITGGMQR